MSDESSKDVWSKQFYKALEAVGNLTEQERLKLGNMLISLSDIKDKPSQLKREIPPYDPQPLRSEYNHTLTDEDLPKHSCGVERYIIPPPPRPPETRKLKSDGLIPKKPVYPEKVDVKV